MGTSLGTAPSTLGVSTTVDAQVRQYTAEMLWENTTKRILLLAMLAKKGNINYQKKHGKYCEWQARVGRHQAGYRADMAERNFERQNHRVTYSTAYAFLEMTSALSERDLMFLDDANAYKSEKDTKMAEMAEDFRQDVNNRLLSHHAQSNPIFGQAAVSGVPAGEVAFKGVLEALGYGASAQDYDFEAQSTSGAIGAGDREALPNVTYHGVGTHPTNAIANVHNKLNESTSPKIANWSSTGWDGSSTTWRKNGPEVVSHLLQRCSPSEIGEKPDVGIMPIGMYNDLKNGLRDEATLEVTMGPSPQDPDLGLFSDKAFNYEGCLMGYDDDALPNVLLMVNCSKEGAGLKVFPQRPVGGPNTGVGVSKNLTNRRDFTFRFNTAPLITHGAEAMVGTALMQFWCNPRLTGAACNLA